MNSEKHSFPNLVLILPAIAVIGLLAVSYHTSISASAPILQLSKISKRTSLPTYTTMTETEKSSLFEDFKTKFSRKYDTEDEESSRYQNFLKTLEVIDERNAAETSNGGSAVHGITKFADFTTHELKSMLGYRDVAKLPKMSNKLVDHVPKSPTPVTSVDWSGVYTTAVKDQGYCGSCWAFSAAEQIESDAIRAGLLTTSDELSPQQIVSCDTYSDGCDGGITISAYYYVYQTGGIDSESAYPYTSYYDVTGTCSVDTTSYQVTVSDYYVLANETVMEDYMLSTGPISVCLAASTWYTYTSGVLSTCDTEVDHCVQAVGLNMDSETNGYDEGYWIVRNSWGTDWGVAGNIYLKSGENLCDISYLSTYVTAAPASTSSSSDNKKNKDKDTTTTTTTTTAATTEVVEEEEKEEKTVEKKEKVVVEDEVVAVEEEEADEEEEEKSSKKSSSKSSSSKSSKSSAKKSSKAKKSKTDEEETEEDNEKSSSSKSSNSKSSKKSSKSKSK